MKNLLLIFSVLLSTSLSAVEYGYIKSFSDNNDPPSDSSRKIVLLEGDVLEILSLSSRSSSHSIIAKDSSGSTIFNQQFKEIYEYITNTILVGECTVWCYSPYNATFFYKLTRASEVEYKNVNIVSLPSSAVGQGTHEIVVEASDDLQSWTPVHSSSIGGDKTFFRTRVVEAE